QIADCFRVTMAHRRKCKARATRPGFWYATLRYYYIRKPERSTSSGDLAERLGDAALERLGRLGRDLLGKRCKLFGLLGESLEVLARMGGRELDDLGERLHVEQLAGVVERRISVGAGRLDHLEVIVGSSLGGGRVGILEQVGRLFGSGLDALVGIFRLRHALLGDLAERRGNLELGQVELRQVELGQFEDRTGWRGRFRRLGLH